MLEHRHLHYFTAVAEELNFSRAADRLHMAQPPLSVAIRKLEREVGTELLSRTTREVRLTDAGVMFLAGARRILDELEHTVRATRRAAAGELGSLRLAFSGAARYETLPMLGRAFRASHPDVELVTEEMWNANIIPALRSGAVDAALCVCPEHGADVVYDTVRSERIVALLPIRHPLAERGELALGELSEEVFILVKRELSPRLHDTLVAACRRAGFEPKLRSGGLQSAWELEAMADLGHVSLGPESVSLDLPGGLVAVPVSVLDERVETALVARVDEASPIIAAVREVARSLFRRGALAVATDSGALGDSTKGSGAVAA
jgi:DNA-binding transcriptional LysR family regulator